VVVMDLIVTNVAVGLAFGGCGVLAVLVYALYKQLGHVRDRLWSLESKKWVFLRHPIEDLPHGLPLEVHASDVVQALSDHFKLEWVPGQNSGIAMPKGKRRG